VNVPESGGDEREIAKLVKELRTATQKAKSDFEVRPTTGRRSTSQRWSSTDDDYLPDRPHIRSDLQSRSRTHANLTSRSQQLDSRSSVDGYSLSRRQRFATEAGYGRQGSSLGSCEDDVFDDEIGLRREKTDLDRSFHTAGSPREYRNQSVIVKLSSLVK